MLAYININIHIRTNTCIHTSRLYAYIHTASILTLIHVNTHINTYINKIVYTYIIIIIIIICLFTQWVKRYINTNKRSFNTVFKKLIPN